MAFSERAIESPAVSLRALCEGAAAIEGSTQIEGSTHVGIKDLIDEILRSGLPGIRDLAPNDRGRQLDGYREHLQRLNLLDPLEAWVPALAPLKLLTYSPKHHLVDPALAASLVGVGAKGLLTGEGETISTSSGTWLGALFESLATQSTRVYADGIGARVGHLRTKNGDHEVDLIVEADDLRCVALEVKAGDTVRDDDVRHLLWLSRQLEDRIADSVVLHAGPRPDGVAVVPFALLGP